MEHFYSKLEGWAGGIDGFYATVLQSIPTPSLQINPATSKIEMQNSRQYHFVEVGSWKGMSAAFLAVEIINSGKNIKFDCVDTWRGSAEHQTMESVINDTLYDEFINNMKPVEGYYNAIRMPSVAAAKTYQDASLDLVFIDAGHEYENVKADILAWMPKVRPGGIIAGHDYVPGYMQHVYGAVVETVPDHKTIDTGCVIWYKEVQ